MLDEYEWEQVIAIRDVIAHAEESLSKIDSDKRRANLREAVSRSKDMVLDHVLMMVDQKDFMDNILKPALTSEVLQRIREN